MNETLHPISEIASSIQQIGDRLVLLRREESPLLHAAHSESEIEQIAKQTLEEPLDFPPLSTAIVPGDRVAIAVAGDVPQLTAVLHGALEAFSEAGIEADAISIVAASADTAQRCRDAFADASPSPAIVVHDPDDNDALCMIGLNKRKEPIKVNRTIFEADVVLPIGCARMTGSVFDCLFPAFSSAEALEQYQTPVANTKNDNDEKRAKEIDEAGWLIGALMAMLVVPGPDESVTDIVVGEPRAVEAKVRELMQSLWSRHSSQQVSLVIANISGGTESQTWQNIGRALASAEPLLDEGGAIALCSNLAVPPGESIARLIGSDDVDKTKQRILRDHGPDTTTALQLARALQRGPVYFLSQLDEETVEDLGFAPIGSIADLARLASRHESCVVIDDSQHTDITVN